MTGTDQTSLRKRLHIAFLYLAVGPLLLMGGILTWQSYSTQRSQAIELQKEIVERATGQIVEYLNSIEDETRLALKAGNIMKLTREEQENLLSRMRSHKGISHGDVFNELALLDNTGKELARVSRVTVYPDTVLGDRSGDEEFVWAMREGKVYYSPVWFDAGTGEPFITMGLPVSEPRTGAVEGVIIADIRLKDIWNLVSWIEIGKGGSVYILDGSGKVIAHKEPSMVLKGTRFIIPGEAGVYRGLLEEIAVIASQRIVLGSRVLYVVTERPLLEAFALTIRITVITVLLLVLSMAGVISLGLVVRREIIKPIELLVRTAGLIEKGDLSVKAQPAGNYELDALAGAFNNMAGQLISIIGSLRQRIAERDEANEKLEEKGAELNDAHNRLLSVLDSLDAVVYVADMKTYEVLFVNKYLRDKAGDVVGGVCWKSFQEGQTGPCEFCTNKRLLTADGEPAGVYEWEFRNTFDGRWYAIRDRAIRWIDGRIVRLEIAMDITEHKKMEEERQKKSNLEAIGTLAVGIAHEINNPLTNASLNIQILRGKIGKDIANANDDILKRISMVERNIDKASIIARELLQFSRQPEEKFTAVNVNEIIAGAVTLIEYKLGGIDVHQSMKDLPPVYGDPVKLEQVFINILNNSVDAMPGGGTIHISTSYEDGQVKAEISDTGAGIPGDVLPRVFEPFYTTKDVGAGTGLGLSTSYAIIQQHKGSIDISSVEGKGTTVTVRLQAMGEDVDFSI